MLDKQLIIEHYMDLEGMVTVDCDPTPWSTGNGLMHLGLFICLLHANNELEKYDKDKANVTFTQCEKVPGVFNRNRNRPDANAHDDYAGIVSASVVCDLNKHKDILQYGLKHLFTYNNIEPGKFINGWNPLKWEWWTFRLRFPFHILWYFIVNKRLTFLTPLLIVYLYLNLTSPIGYSHLLNYQIIESLAFVNESFKKSMYAYFMKRLPLVESCADYFKPEHPIVNLAQEVINKAKGAN